MSLNPNESEILARLCALAAEQVGLDPSGVTGDSDLFTDLNFDSLDAVEYVMKLEDAFDVSIADQQAEGVRTPRQALAILLPALLEKRGP